MDELAIVFGYRNREPIRVKRCLESLSKQTDSDFRVVFVDYGSEKIFADHIKEIVAQYGFVDYHYSFTQGWFWNRAHALNTGVRIAGDVTFVVTSDIDLIFPIDFVSQLKKNLKPDLELHIVANNLPEKFDRWDQLQDRKRAYGKKRGNTALGLVQGVAKSVFERVGGFDEYYCIWGAEDEDLNERLKKVGIETKWLDINTPPLYHQWHATSGPRSFNLPSRWQEVLVNYKFQMREDINRNQSGIWGKLIKSEDRLLFDLNSDKEIINLQGLPVYLALTKMMEKIDTAKSGDILNFDLYKSKDNEATSKLVSLLNWVNKGLDRIDSPVMLVNDLTFYRRRNGLLDYRDTIAYLVLENRDTWSDYYLDIDSGNLKFAVVK